MRGFSVDLDGRDEVAEPEPAGLEVERGLRGGGRSDKRSLAQAEIAASEYFLT